MTAASSPEDSGTAEYGVQRLYPDGEPYGAIKVCESRAAARFWGNLFTPETYRIVVRYTSAWRPA